MIERARWSSSTAAHGAASRATPRPGTACTIVTHSPTVAVQLAEHPLIDIIVLGGRLFRHSMVGVGASVIDAASRLRADLYFMGVTGVHPKRASARRCGRGCREASAPRARRRDGGARIVRKADGGTPFVVGSPQGHQSFGRAPKTADR